MSWNWQWRRQLFVWEHELLNELEEILQGACVVFVEQDSWIWLLDPISGFSVAATYKLVQNALAQEHNPTQHGSTYNKLWDCMAPSWFGAYSTTDF